MHIVKFFTAFVCLILLAVPPSSASKIYKWVDKNGIIHFTNDPATIPLEYRGLVEESNSKTDNGVSIEKIERSSKNAFDKVVRLLEGNREKILVGIPLVAVLIVLVYSLRSYLRLEGPREKQRRLRALELLNIDSIDEAEFERYVRELLAHRGFKVVKTGDSINLGVDFIAQKNNLRYAIQIVQKTGSVSRVAVSDADREKHHYGCERAMVITNGYFTQDAMELSLSKGCDLVDRDTLAKWVVDFQKSNDK
jgi:restriction endonuclease/uncharacterized protein DUF4124